VGRQLEITTLMGSAAEPHALEMSSIQLDYDQTPAQYSKGVFYPQPFLTPKQACQPLKKVPAKSKQSNHSSMTYMNQSKNPYATVQQRLGNSFE
jgi:hypothetical protein